MPQTATLEAILTQDTSVLCSDRFEIQEFLNRGAWGSVYKAKDLETNEIVAIKICDPTVVGKRLMLERHLDEDKVMRKELLKRGSTGPNVVPREFYRDKNGRPFIVMPYFEKFLSDEIALRKKNPRPASWGTPLPTGFTTQEVLRYITDIVKGVAHIHKRYKRAHCDLKPENIAIDSEDTPQISDFGTSTYVASPRPHAGQRGHLYIMSPTLLKGDADPKLRCDVFSIGSLLFKLFTGKFIFEDEIDQALKTEDGLERLADRFVEKRESGYIVHTDTFQEVIRQKIASSKIIPPGIDKFVQECLCESYHDGTNMSHNLERAIDEYHKAQGKEAAIKEVKNTLYVKFLEGLGLAVFGTTLVAGLAWGAYYSTPDFSTKTDIETKAVKRVIKDADILFEAEKNYPFVPPNRTSYAAYDNLMKLHLEKFHDKSLADRFITNWIETATDRGMFDAFGRFIPRYQKVFMRQLNQFDHAGNLLYANDYLKEYLPHVLRANTLDDKTVDLEDTVTWILCGPDVLRNAIKAKNNTNYSVYKNALDTKGSLLISLDDQKFIDTFCYNFIRRCSNNISYKR